MDLRVTNRFLRELEGMERTNPGIMSQVEAAFEKFHENPQSVRWESKTGGAGHLNTMRLPNGNRIVFAQDANGQFIPAFVGNHDDYMKFLKNSAANNPDNLFGQNDNRITTIDLDVEIPTENLNDLGPVAHNGGIPDYKAPDLPQDVRLANKILDDKKTEGFWGDRQGRTQHYYNAETNTYVGFAEGQPPHIVIGPEAEAIYKGKLDRAGIALGDRPIPITGGFQGVNDAFHLTHNGRFARLLERGGDIAAFVGRAAKVLGPAGVIGATAEAAELGVSAHQFHNMGLISDEALSSYDKLVGAHLAQATVDPTLLGGEIAVQLAFDAWAEEHDIPDYIKDQLEPGSLVEDIIGEISSDEAEPLTQEQAQTLVDGIQDGKNLIKANITEFVENHAELFRENGFDVDELGAEAIADKLLDNSPDGGFQEIDLASNGWLRTEIYNHVVPALHDYHNLGQRESALLRDAEREGYELNTGEEPAPKDGTNPELSTEFKSVSGEPEADVTPDNDVTEEADASPAPSTPETAPDAAPETAVVPKRLVAENAL